VQVAAKPTASSGENYLEDGRSGFFRKVGIYQTIKCHILQSSREFKFHRTLLLIENVTFFSPSMNLQRCTHSYFLAGLLKSDNPRLAPFACKYRFIDVSSTKVDRSIHSSGNIMLRKISLLLVSCCFVYLFLNPEDGGILFFRNINFHRTSQIYIPEGRTLRFQGIYEY
jgi:hypothetical protein